MVQISVTLVSDLWVVAWSTKCTASSSVHIFRELVTSSICMSPLQSCHSFRILLVIGHCAFVIPFTHKQQNVLLGRLLVFQWSPMCHFTQIVNQWNELPTKMKTKKETKGDNSGRKIQIKCKLHLENPAEHGNVDIGTTLVSDQRPKEFRNLLP